MTDVAKPPLPALVTGTPSPLDWPEPPHRSDIGSVLRHANSGLDSVEDEELAGHSTGTLLITGGTRDEIEVLARRVHNASARAAAPFVMVHADALSIEPRMLGLECSALQDAAAGGSILLMGIEETPPLVQGVLVEKLTEVHSGRGSSRGVRLIAGTTASLLDRVAEGRFSERLLYRLNVIHLVASRDAGHLLRR